MKWGRAPLTMFAPPRDRRAGRSKGRLGVRTAVFDLDGTLADTSADLIAAANATLAEGGIPGRLAPGADDAIAFAGGRAMLREGQARAGIVDEAAVDRLYPRLLETYGRDLAVHTRLYDGVEAAMDRLAETGWTLAVCTNKPERLAALLLKALRVEDRFRVMLGADSLPFRKPDPRHLLETIARAGGDPARAVLVGDTVTDRETARAAGIPCVLVDFGAGDDLVAHLAPEGALRHFDDLADLLERLVPAP